jgi:hypothetical protein
LNLNLNLNLNLEIKKEKTKYKKREKDLTGLKLCLGPPSTLPFFLGRTLGPAIHSRAYHTGLLTVGPRRSVYVLCTRVTATWAPPVTPSIATVT